MTKETFIYCSRVAKRGKLLQNKFYDMVSYRLAIGIEIHFLFFFTGLVYLLSLDARHKNAHIGQHIVIESVTFTEILMNSIKSRSV